MFIELMCGNADDVGIGSFTANKFILDTSDDSVEFITKKNYEKVKEIYDIDCFVMNLLPEHKSIFAKLALMHDNLVIYRNNLVNIRVIRSDVFSLWKLELEIINKGIAYIDSLEYDETKNIFNWFSSERNNAAEARFYYSAVSDYYVGYLLCNQDKLKSEMKNILAHTCFMEYVGNNTYDLIPEAKKVIMG